MSVLKKSSDGEDNAPRKRRTAPARTIEAQENQLILLANELAAKQLSEGTASSQVISHFLKLGSTRDRLEREILENQRDLLAAKRESIQSGKNVDELYSNAINAMKKYSGKGGDEDED